VVVKVLLFGASGMVGQGALRECLVDAEVEGVLSVVRAPTGRSDPKLRELVRDDFHDLGAEVDGYDACLFCAGVSSAGMKEADYHRVTYDLTLDVARALAARNPQMTFIYVSGAGTDATEKGSSMWARVKGKTENALLALPFKAAYMFRPAFIQPRHGVRSRTRWYRIFYLVTAPLFPLLRWVARRWVTTSDRVGRAMLRVARDGAPRRILENAEIDAIGA